jgi:hypothetical protein
MKATRFFRVLWRINGLVIFLASVIAILVLGFIAIEFMDFGRNKSEQVVKVDQPAEEKEELPELLAFQTVFGTPFLRAELTFGDKYSRGSFSSSSGSYSTRNYLFLNPETLESQWLFPDNKQLIVESDNLSAMIQEKESEIPTSHTVAFLYKMIDTDTNGDRKLTAGDKYSIAYSRPDGRQFTTVIKGVDKVLGSHTTNDGKKHVVVYEMGKKWYTAVISLSTFQIEKQGEIPAR